MLCKRPSARIEETIKEMGASMFFIEEKLDGERMQLHKRGNEYFYCSRFVPDVVSVFELSRRSYRKGKDYTYLYGSHVGTGSLTPYITGAFDERVEEYAHVPIFIFVEGLYHCPGSFLMVKCSYMTRLQIGICHSERLRQPLSVETSLHIVRARH